MQILLTSWSAFPLLEVESVFKLCNQGKRIIFENDLWRRFCFRKQSFREPLILTEYELNVSCYKIFFHILYFWWFWRCLSYTFFLMILKMQVRSNVIFMQVNNWVEIDLWFVSQIKHVWFETWIKNLPTHAELLTRNRYFWPIYANVKEAFF